MKSRNKKSPLSKDFGDKIIDAAKKSIDLMLIDKATRDHYVVFAEGKKYKKVKARKILEERGIKI